MATLPTVLRNFIIACLCLEGLALLGQAVGPGEALRNAMVALGGFWPSLLGGAAPLYPGQGIVMFASSVFLHGNPLHLMMNMVGLLWLGPMVVERIGARGFWPLAGWCALGAGAVYAVLSEAGLPMVGASGVLFGFLGAVAAWVVCDRLERRQSLAPLVMPSVGFVALNLALTVSAGGGVAWQAHLGGLLAGGIAGLLTWHRTFPPGRAGWIAR